MDKHGSMAFAAGVDDATKFRDDVSISKNSDNDAEKFRITKSVLYFYDEIPVT